MVIHAGTVLSKFHIGKDGRTAQERIKGRRCRRPQIEFGECVMYLKPGTEGKNKADQRWEDGIYLGMRERREEYFMGTKEGVRQVRTARRHDIKQNRIATY